MRRRIRRLGQGHRQRVGERTMGFGATPEDRVEDDANQLLAQVQPNLLS